MSKRPRSVASNIPPDQTADGRAELSLEARDEADDAANANEQGVTRTPDGGAIIDLDADKPKKEKAKTDGHFDNLAEDEQFKDKLAGFASDTWEDIQLDIESANKADENYAKALGDTGVTGKAAGGASFPGASTVTHPLLGEVCSDYAARVTREIISPKGPAKPHVEGAPTKEKWDRAKRVSRYMNWQTRKQMRNFATEIEQGFTQQPYAGAFYIKLWKEGKKKKKPRIAFIPKDKVHRPASSDDFYDSERITHEFNLSERQLDERMRSGLYVDREMGAPPTDPEKTRVEVAADKATGTSDPGENVDNTRAIYETSCFWDGEGELRPYILTQDKETKTVLGMYRNWEPDAEDDEACERLDFLVEFGFMPFRGGKPIGLAQMLSGIPRAATGALRALLDSALANNFPGGSKLKSGQSGSTTMAAPGTYEEVENATQTDDIRKLILPNEYNPPSAVLFQLLGFVVDAGKGMVRTQFDDIIGKGNHDIPVGTMMMLVDEGTVVYSSIFGRQHRAMGRLLENLYRLNGQIVTNAKFSDKDGDDVVTEFDFEGDSLVVPTSDPRINSDTQRWTRANFLASRATPGQGAPPNPLYNAYEVEKMLLEAAQIENIDQVLVKPRTPTELAAPNENVALVLARPIMAFPDQGHLSHLESHADFVQSSIFGASPAMAQAILPPMLQHMKEHIALEYAARTMHIVNEQIIKAASEQPALLAQFEKADGDEEKLGIVAMMKLKDPKLGQKIDKLFAAVSHDVLGKLQADLVKIESLMAKMAQQVQQMTPPPPMDPAHAALAAANIGAQTTTGVAKLKDATEQKKIATDAQTDQDNLALREHELAQDSQEHRIDVAEQAAESDQRRESNTEDNNTALTIAAERIASGSSPGVSTGTGINPGTR